MKKGYIEEEVLKEYGRSRIPPYKYSIGNEDVYVPFAYADPYSGIEKFTKDLFKPYLHAASDIKKYSDSGTKIRFISFANVKIVVPYKFRDLSDKEVREKINNAVLKRYNRAVFLTREHNRIFPMDIITVKVSPENVSKLEFEHEEYLLSHAKETISKATAKAREIITKECRLQKHSVKGLTENKLSQALNNFKSKGKNALHKLIIPTAILAGVSFGIHKCNTDSEQPNTTNNGSTEQVKDTSQAFNQEKENQKAVRRIMNYLAEQGITELNEVQKHNLDTYIRTRNANMVMAAFSENYAPKAYDDGKGFNTIGFGTIQYLDTNGHPLECTTNVKTGEKTSKVQPGDRLCLNNAVEQVFRYNDCRVVPQIITDVKVKLTDEQMIATANLAYVVGGGQFSESSFLKALNEKKSTEELGQCLSMWYSTKNPGLPKRLYFPAMILAKKITTHDILKLRAEGCYTLDLEDCYKCVKNKDGSIRQEIKKIRTFFKDKRTGRKKVKVTRKIHPMFAHKNGKTMFDPHNAEQCIAKAKTEHISPKIDPDHSVKFVYQIVPEYVVKNLIQQKTTNFNNSLFKQNATKSKDL